MVKVAIDQVVDVVAVRNGWVATAGSMHMVFLVPSAVMGRGAAIRVGGINLENVLIDVAGMWVMQVAVMQVVNMTLVLNGQVTTARSVLMIVVCVNLAVAHGGSVGLRIWLGQGSVASQSACRSLMPPPAILCHSALDCASRGSKAQDVCRWAYIRTLRTRPIRHGTGDAQGSSWPVDSVHFKRRSRNTRLSAALAPVVEAAFHAGRLSHSDVPRIATRPLPYSPRTMTMPA